MAGSGAAMRLHEFKERQDFDTYTRKPGSALRVTRQGKDVRGLYPVQLGRVTRQGKDVRGLYPGQLGRVHVISSQDRRLKFASLQHSQGPDDDQYDEYARSFDLQTFQALDILHQSPSACQCASETTYQEEFGAQSLLYHQ